MTDASFARPRAEIFEHAGATIELVDVATLLAAARANPVEPLRRAEWPAPVHRVDLTVDGTGGAGHVFTARITTMPSATATRRMMRGFVLNIDPLGPLLARRIAEGDQVVTRLVDGVGIAAAAAYRKLGLEKPVEPSLLADASAGIEATVSFDGTVAVVESRVPRDEVGPAHLRAFIVLMLQAVTEFAGPDSLAGRRFTVSRDNLPRTPATAQDVTLDMVGGLADVVAELRQIAVSFRHPEVMARWGARRPQGILMYGPPGTGKTMLSRALANEIGADFREVRTPEILDKWLGGSEKNLKEIFRSARRYRTPTLILFDEFDSIVSYAGGGGDAASQALNAVAGIFKQEMNDLIEENPNVIIVATTNFPQRVDESLIRSGRFDVKISVPRPDGTTRAEIFRKMIRGLINAHEQPGFRMFADDLDPAALGIASGGMTGADIKEVLRRVQLAKAMQEARGGEAGPITQQELITAIEGLRGTS
ncbi:MAG TPA: ATP-binding protein [Actinoplanes sp.]|nr:ATP-binding protein [Actinoplanes sp.]